MLTPRIGRPGACHIFYSRVTRSPNRAFSEWHADMSERHWRSASRKRSVLEAWVWKRCSQTFSFSRQGTCSSHSARHISLDTRDRVSSTGISKSSGYTAQVPGWHCLNSEANICSASGSFFQTGELNQTCTRQQQKRTGVGQGCIISFLMKGCIIIHT